jgi:hypothetical protein
MQDKWSVKKKKGYLKIHVAVNIKTKKILSIKVTEDVNVHDSKALSELVQNIIKSNSVTASKLFANGAYDNNSVFKYLTDNGILPCIKIRKNSRVIWKKGTSLGFCSFDIKKIICKDGKMAIAMEDKNGL